MAVKAAAEFSPLDGLRYGALGLALAFVALPLYVHLPQHYAAEFGVPLATLGALLLAARALDAVADPWIGRLCDRALGRRALLWQMPLAGVLVAAGFAALFFNLGIETWFSDRVRTDSGRVESPM